MSSSGSRGDGDGNPRPIQDMQGLLKFCVQESGSASEDGTAPSVGMTPERRAWLEEAIKNMSVDVVQEMLEAIEIVKNELYALNHQDETVEADEALDKILNSIDGLMDRTQDLDLAGDFVKIGGFDILPPLLQSPHSQLKSKGAELVAELVQNHEFCQKSALDMNILDTLVKILDSNDIKDEVKVKALYAVSCLIRGNSKGQEIFENKLDGFSVLLRVMQSSSQVEGPKLRTKSAFLLGSIIQESSTASSPRSGMKDILFRMGYIEQLVGLLHMEHDLSHEHLLSALLTFISDFEPGVKECRRKELQLKELLRNRIQFLNKKEEHLEEDGYCKQILELCFNNGEEGGSETVESQEER